MICPECLSVYKQGSAYCGYCGTAITSESPGERYPAGPHILGAPASQFPRTPGDQYIPSVAAGQHSPPDSARPREFRLDLRRLSRADQTVGGASLVVLVSLFLPWFGVGELGANLSVSGTTAHGYLVIVVVTALVIPGYMLLRSGWHDFPAALAIAHERLLLAGTGLQFLLVLTGFLDLPLAGLSWKVGAYVALLASLAAAVPVALPAVRAWRVRR